MLESEIQAKILQQLKKRGIFAYKNIVTNRAGIPDITAIIGGKAVFFEVKRDKSRPLSPNQQHISELITTAGGDFYKICTIEQLDEALRNYG